METFLLTAICVIGVICEIGSFGYSNKTNQNYTNLFLAVFAPIIAYVACAGILFYLCYYGKLDEHPLILAFEYLNVWPIIVVTWNAIS